MGQQNHQAGAILTIDLDAIRENYRLLCRKAGRAACAAVLKADAYGLGAAQVGAVLAADGCRHFFVAHLDEAIALRSHLPEQAELFVLHGPMAGAEEEFVRHRVIPVLNGIEQIVAWRQLAQRMDCSLPAVIQIDTGMSRLGLSPHEVDAWATDNDFLRGIDLRYLMSHLACAEQQNDPVNLIQLQAFEAVRRRLPACRASFANSSGIFLGEAFHFDLVRPGAALYGIAPVAGAENPMQPVVRLQGKIIQSRHIGPGDRVGYGLTYRADSSRCIATVSVGYADGWLRSFSNRGMALIDGVAVPLVGIVSMDTMTLDVTGIPAPRLHAGALVDLLNAEQTVNTAAGLGGTIAYEILTSLGHRYRRDYIGGQLYSARAA